VEVKCSQHTFNSYSHGQYKHIEDEDAIYYVHLSVLSTYRKEFRL